MDSEIKDLLNKAKELAKKYKNLTGKPLGITGEIAEFIAADLFNLELAEARQSGYDGVYYVNGNEIKVQIKGRSLPEKYNPGARIGNIRLDHDWDTVMLVIMNEALEPVEVYEANRKSITEALLKPGSKARNERGSLGISKFKSIGTKIWPK